MNLEPIIQEAKRKGVCKEWHEKMKQDPSVERFCDMYFRGSDWAMEKDFPSAEMLEQFPETEAYGLFVNKKYKGDTRLKMAFFGISEVELEAKDYAVSQIYARHQTSLKISASGYAKVFINLLDSTKIEAIATQNAYIVIYDYRTEKKETELKGNVKINSCSLTTKSE